MLKLLVEKILNIYILSKINYFNYKILYPELEILKDNKDLILKDLLNLESSWIDWPEKYLYNDGGWKVIPFYAFEFYIKKNCDLCPNIYNLLKKIPNLKTALLSRLSPKTKLSPHKGWAELANHILRCHYGIKVPEECYLYVNNEKKQIKQNQIVVFDDSKRHYAENNSSKDRIILIIDIERPDYLPQGTSRVDSTPEILELVMSHLELN